ncbi:DUF1445 domain-containing protein [Streptomyces sp. NPDC052701]|uniref:D-glutamate cyclase family protein n=1 Tax=Streptomyces sp. NPDC052701 TaxID=3155533 RepID=UPI00341A5859
MSRARTGDRPVTAVAPQAHAWSPHTARARFREGLTGPTAGVAAGRTQANLISVPADWAYDMLLFCQRNPKPCPVLDVTDAGSRTTVFADGAGLRTGPPHRRVRGNGGPADVRAYRRGGPADTVPDGIPVFRTCGAAPRAAVTVSRPPFAPARAPGRMSPTDAREEQDRVA